MITDNNTNFPLSHTVGELVSEVDSKEPANQDWLTDWLEWEFHWPVMDNWSEDPLEREQAQPHPIDPSYRQLLDNVKQIYMLSWILDAWPMVGLRILLSPGETLPTHPVESRKGKCDVMGFLTNTSHCYGIILRLPDLKVLSKTPFLILRFKAYG